MSQTSQPEADDDGSRWRVWFLADSMARFGRIRPEEDGELDAIAKSGADLAKLTLRDAFLGQSAEQQWRRRFLKAQIEAAWKISDKTTLAAFAAILDRHGHTLSKEAAARLRALFISSCRAGAAISRSRARRERIEILFASGSLFLSAKKLLSRLFLKPEQRRDSGRRDSI